MRHLLSTLEVEDGSEVARYRGYCDPLSRRTSGNRPPHGSIHRHACLDCGARRLQGRSQEIERENPRIDPDGLARRVSGLEVLTSSTSHLKALLKSVAVDQPVICKLLYCRCNH